MLFAISAVVLRCTWVTMGGNGYRELRSAWKPGNISAVCNNVEHIEKTAVSWLMPAKSALRGSVRMAGTSVKMQGSNATS